MRLSYLISPIVLMAVFSLVFWQHKKTAAVEEQAAAVQAAALKAEAEKKKQDAIDKARDEAAKRAEARAAEERQKEADKRAKWEAAGQRLADEIAANEKSLAAHAAAVRQLEADLAAARAAKQALTEKFFALGREAELDRIAKRNAELELQRLTEMLARKAGTTLAVSP